MDVDTPTRYDVGEDEAYSRATVRAVATERGVEPTEVAPLFEVVAAEALDEVMESLRTAPDQEGSQVSFTYAGHRVTADSRGYVDLRPR